VGSALPASGPTGASLDDLAAELVHLPADVIVARGDPPLVAALAATSSIPIVMLGWVADPVAAGYAESLAHPGRNLTGVTGTPPEAHIKRLQILVEAVPGISRVALFGGFADTSRADWTNAARSLGVALISLPDPLQEGFEAVFQEALAQRADGLLVLTGQGSNTNGALIASLAERYRLPAMYELGASVTGGGLMAYEAREDDIERRCADIVDRILHGTRTVDLPIERPTRFNLVVNLAAARAIDLDLAPDFMAQVDQVIG